MSNGAELVASRVSGLSGICIVGRFWGVVGGGSFRLSGVGVIRIWG